MPAGGVLEFAKDEEVDIFGEIVKMRHLSRSSPSSAPDGHEMDDVERYSGAPISQRTL